MQEVATLLGVGFSLAQLWTRQRAGMVATEATHFALTNDVARLLARAGHESREQAAARLGQLSTLWATLATSGLLADNTAPGNPYPPRAVAEPA